MADKSKEPAFPTPSDVLGAVQRGLRELHAGLELPAEQLNIAACLAQLEEMHWRLSHLKAQTQPAANGKSSEARAN